MATATHIGTKLILAQSELSSTLGVNFDDTTAAHFVCGIVVAGNGIPVTEYFNDTSITGTTTSASNTITSPSVNPVTAGVLPNMAISGTGIPAGTYVQSVTSTTIVMTQNATASAAGVALTITGGVQFIADVTATNAEMSYSGYARQDLTGITNAVASNGTQVDWDFSNVTFPQEAADPGTGRYGFIAWLGASGSYTDAAAPVVAILDFGQTVSTVNGSLVLEPPAGGLINFTGGG